MAQASRDENRVPTLLATLNSDGSTTVPVKVSATNHGLRISDGSSGSDNGGEPANRDENRVPTLLAVSSVDGETPVAVYTDSNGNLFIDSN